jgi:hypothetical protein
VRDAATARRAERRARRQFQGGSAASVSQGKCLFVTNKCFVFTDVMGRLI